MTDAQILMGIMQNDNRAWQYVCRNMKAGFISIIVGIPSYGVVVKPYVEDIFQEACMTLMRKVKSGQVAVSREGGLFSYLVQIGKLTAFNVARKRDSVVCKTIEVSVLEDCQELAQEGLEVSEKQQSQDEFLDRVFDSIPDDCRMLLKKFYWDHKPMDEIASMLGLRNADTAKTKKNRCMNKFKEIAKMLLENEAFAEDAVRAAVERAALRELLEDERVMMEQTGIEKAALDVKDEDDEK